MSFFDFYKLTIWGVKEKPTRMPPLVHPEKVPLTMRVSPEGFPDYLYSGPGIEKMMSQQGTRYPALVARLIRKYHLASGVCVEEEMTASLKDLKRGQHPQAEEIRMALCHYFETNIQKRGSRKLLHPGSKSHTLETLS